MPTKYDYPEEKLEGYDEVLERLLQSITPEEILRAAGTERLLGSLPPEEILRAAGTERLLGSLPPEEILRAAGTERLLGSLPPEQILLALPDSILRELKDEYIRTLPADIEAAIRKRIGMGRPT